MATKAESCLIYDMGSRLGTVHNDEPISGLPVPLSNFDTISIRGEFLLEWTYIENQGTTDFDLSTE